MIKNLPEFDSIQTMSNDDLAALRKRLEKELQENGCAKVTVANLARDDMHEAVEDAFRYGKIVLASTTYNGDIFPFMREFVNELTERNYQNRTVGIVENGTWAPLVAKKIAKMFENSKGIEYAQNTVTIHSGIKEENIEQIKLLAKELA